MTLLPRLRRITRDGNWVREIDGLRFVAIASVFLYHLAGELSMRSGRTIPIEPQFWALTRILANGDRGVRLFFVISGMILALPYARHFLLGGKAVSLRKYYLRRVTRLEPPYILSVLLGVALLAIHWHGLPAGFGAHVLASLVYQHNLIYGEMSAVNMVAWSLEVEIQFYIFAPLFMQLFRVQRKSLRRAVMLGGVLLIGVAQIWMPFTPRFYMSILYYLQYFLAGLLVADVFVLDLARLRTSWLWDAVGIAALGLMFWPLHEAFWPQVVLPFVLAPLCVAAMRSVALRRVFANESVAVFGGMCYSIYLLHMTLISVLFKVTRKAILPYANYPANLVIQVVVTGLPVLALCALYFVLVERPCMDPDWPSKLWHAVTGHPGSEVDALDTAGISE